MAAPTSTDMPLSSLIPATPPAWRRLLLIVLLVGLAGAGSVGGLHYWRYAASHVGTDDAALTTDVVQIAPQVSGTVQEVLVEDNQIVHAGDPLVVLDDATYRAAVSQAQANLNAAIAQAKGAGVSVSLTSETGDAQRMQAEGLVAQAQSGIDGARADVVRATAAVTNASAVAKGVEANVGAAAAAVEAARANRERAQATVAAALAQVETAKAGVRAAQAGVSAAEAAADKARDDARRYADLRKDGAVSAQVADHAQVALRTAEAQLEAARRQVEAAQAGVDARQADVTAARQQAAAAEAAIDQAQAQLQATKQQADAAKAGIEQVQAQRMGAEQQVQQAQARYEQALGQMTQANTAPRQVDVSRSNAAQATARIDQARAALESARIQLRYTRIVAPVSGQVCKKTAQVGALVQPGTPLMAIVPTGSIWVVANYKETQLARVQSGQPADITVDALHGQHFHGHVDSIAAATGATFALLPADNATGNFTKVVQRIPVKIMLDPGQPDASRLRAGMSVMASIATR